MGIDVVLFKVSATWLPTSILFQSKNPTSTTHSRALSMRTSVLIVVVSKIAGPFRSFIADGASSRLLCQTPICGAHTKVPNGLAPGCDGDDVRRSRHLTV